MADTETLTVAEAEDLAFRACLGAGADEQGARSLAAATISAHLNGRDSVGFGHMLDYLQAFRSGKLNGRAEPRLFRPFPAFIASDADRGLAQLGFDRAFDHLCETARSFGIAIFTQHNAFSSGELGYYPRRVAETGLAAMAFTNANAIMAPAPGFERIYSTNPFAFAFPLQKGMPPIVIDQSASTTAFVNVFNAAQRGEALEPGTAIGPDGQPTLDPVAALAGALLPSGGRKGANIALMVELMAAGIGGGDWSRDMADFRSGPEPLNSSLTVIAFSPGARPVDATRRAGEFSRRLREAGVHVPGQGRAFPSALTVPRELLSKVRAFVTPA